MKQDNSLIPKFVSLGLTPLESSIYLQLHSTLSETVTALAKQLSTPPASIRRSLRQLRNLGIVLISAKKPLRLRALDPSVALPLLLAKCHKENQLAANTIGQELPHHKKKHDELSVTFLEGKQKIFSHALPLIKQANTAIDIFSIGEPIPESVFVELVRANKRGATVRLITQQHNKENRELLANWKKNGWNIKFLSTLPEFTLTIYDSQKVVIQIRRNKQSDDRIGIMLSNPGYTEAQQKYFDTLWKQAKEI